MRTECIYKRVNGNPETSVSRERQHGTSTALNLGHVLLPANATNVLREDFRKKLRNVVFITTSKVSAERYAKKAVQRFGGEPVVYTVKPDFASLIQNGTEWTTEKAYIL